MSKKESNFIVKEVEAKLGVTIELKGKWVRIDRGITLEGKKQDDITLGDIKKAFATGQLILEEEVNKEIDKWL